MGRNKREWELFLVLLPHGGWGFEDAEEWANAVNIVFQAFLSLCNLKPWREIVETSKLQRRCDKLLYCRSLSSESACVWKHAIYSWNVIGCSREAPVVRHFQSAAVQTRSWFVICFCRCLHEIFHFIVVWIKVTNLQPALPWLCSDSNFPSSLFPNLSHSWMNTLINCPHYLWAINLHFYDLFTLPHHTVTTCLMLGCDSD